MSVALPLRLDRRGPSSLAEQIRAELRSAIADGRLPPGARLPSWRDLAAQLGVARGTVRTAYERLIDEQLIASAGAAGTYVAARRAALRPPSAPAAGGAPRLSEGIRAEPDAFQLGVPAQDAFPAKAWSRLLLRATRAAAGQSVGYPDGRGERALRQEIAASLALTRGIACSPDQVFITAGYAGGLGLALRVLRAEGREAWMEDPGYLFARRGLELAGVRPVPVPVDAEGLEVAAGVRLAPRAALALVTPGQQAPLGMTLSLARRHALLDWAEGAGAWILEDDYLGELQLKGRAAPALASLDRAGRVIHLGTFSKTISPALRLGFAVVPPALAAAFAEVTALLAPAPAPPVQHAVAEFLRDGHYLRHLRRMKRVYAHRRQALAACLMEAGADPVLAGLAVLQRLPPGTDDGAVAREARRAGLYPMPLSVWHADPSTAPRGLLLGVTNVPESRAAACCAALVAAIDRAGAG